MPFSVGEVRPPTDEDFEHFKQLASINDDWTQVKNSTNIKTFMKCNDESPIKMVKVESTFDDVSADSVYDCLQDQEYRRKWDNSMQEGYRICYVSSNSDIGYYHLKSPFGFRDRDFVTQRAWSIIGNTFIIMNHSVSHKQAEPKGEIVRAVSYLTGYIATVTGPSSCKFTYVSQTDPMGHTPVWATNSAVKLLAPSVLKQLHDAAKHYVDWKAKNNPHNMEWRNFEQLQLFPKFDSKDIYSMNLRKSINGTAEGSMTEEEVNRLVQAQH